MNGRALVTGGAKRLGRAMALYLAGRGYDVAVHYATSDGGAAEVVAEAAALGVKAVAVQADLLDDAATLGLVGQAARALGGPLTVLVNNASIFEYDTIRDATPESWNRNVGSNLRAPLFLTQAFALQAPKALIVAGEPVAAGLVVNIVDQRVLRPTPEYMTYAVAKAALWSLTRTTAQALAPDIRVNAIGPGPTLRNDRQTEAHFARQRAATILQRGADPDDVTAALGYLLDAKSVTGQLICTDGGQHLAWRTPDILGEE